MKEGIRLRKDKREESILKSASKVLSVEGFDGLSMRKIAREEGISEAMLYRFYKNKYSILQSLLDLNLQKIIEDWGGLMETIEALVPDLEISLPIIGKSMAKTINTHQEFFKFMLRDGPKVRRIFHEMNQKLGIRQRGPRIFQKAIQTLNVVEVLTNYFERCKQAGNLRDGLIPNECAIIVISNLVPLIGHLPLFIFQEGMQGIDMVKLVEIQLSVMLHGMTPVKDRE